MTNEREQLDYQFSPNLWTPRIAADDFIPSHVAFCEARSKTYRERLQANELVSLPYTSGGKEENIDVFRPHNVKANAAIIVYIHGGWWQWFSKDMFSFLAEPFNRAGHAVYMPAYTLAQNWNNENPMLSIVEQLEAAMVRIFAEAEQLDAKKIVLVGHSAGGQLVSLLRTTDWEKHSISKSTYSKLSDVFSLAGLFDLRPLVNSYVNAEIGMSVSQAESVSPVFVSPTMERPSSTLHLVLPEYDTAEFYRQTKEYQQQLLQRDEVCKLKVLTGKDHVSMIEELVTDGDELRDYILNQMQGS